MVVRRVVDGFPFCGAVDPKTDKRVCILGKEHDGPHGWELVQRDEETLLALARELLAGLEMAREQVGFVLFEGIEDLSEKAHKILDAWPED